MKRHIITMQANYLWLTETILFAPHRLYFSELKQYRSRGDEHLDNG